MTCWKCGSELESGMECEKCQQDSLTAGFREAHPSTPIDWSKVHTFEDIKEIFDAIGFSIFHESPLYRKLRRFLKD